MSYPRNMGVINIIVIIIMTISIIHIIIIIKFEKKYYYYWRKTIDLIWRVKLKTIKTWVRHV
jgi:hypothetical protein